MRTELRLLFCFILAAFLFAASRTANAQQTNSTPLQSVVVISAEKADGAVQNGLAFLTIRDGIAATALHIVRDAKRVSAKFPNGDEFECSGIIDKDEARNVAFLRIKVFGRPMLTMTANDQPAGAKLSVVAVKDGAFGVVSVTVAEPASNDGTKWARLDGEIPPGNSGAPILDEEANVVGILTLRNIEGKIVGTMIPATFLLALDNSLPTQPWSAATVPQPVPSPSATPAAKDLKLDEVDALIGNALLVLSDNMDVIDWADVGIKGYGFRNGVPQPVYDFEQDLDNAAAKLVEVRTDDALRQKMIKLVLQALGLQKASSESFIRSVVIGQQTGGWGAQAQDAFNRAAAYRRNLEEKLVEMSSDVAELEKQSAKFRESLYPGLRYKLGLAKRPSGFRFGVVTYVRRPMFLLVTYLDGFAYKIGFRPGDTIKSVGDRDLTNSPDLEDVKMAVKENLGKKIKAVVERDGKVQTITLKIPKTIPPEAVVN